MSQASSSGSAPHIWRRGRRRIRRRCRQVAARCGWPREHRTGSDSRDPEGGQERPARRGRPQRAWRAKDGSACRALDRRGPGGRHRDELRGRGLTESTRFTHRRHNSRLERRGARRIVGMIVLSGLDRGGRCVRLRQQNAAPRYDLRDQHEREQQARHRRRTPRNDSDDAHSEPKITGRDRAADHPHHAGHDPQRPGRSARLVVQERMPHRPADAQTCAICWSKSMTTRLTPAP